MADAIDKAAGSINLSRRSFSNKRTPCASLCAKRKHAELFSRIFFFNFDGNGNWFVFIFITDVCTGEPASAG